VAAALGDRRFSARRFPDLERVPRRVRPVASVLARVVLYSDPPAHTRLRTLPLKIPASRLATPLLSG
jgi:cytochrome P450